MFEIGWTEMLVIAVVMIVVVGPKDLPNMLRTFGKTTKKLRAMAGDFQKQFNDALKEAELDDVKKSVDSLRSLNPAAEIRKQLNPFEKAAADVRSGLDAAMKPKPRPADPASPVTHAAEPLKSGAAAMPGASTPAVAPAASVFPAMADPAVATSTAPVVDQGAPAVALAGTTKPPVTKPAAKVAAPKSAVKPAPATKAAAKPAAAKPVAAKPAAKAAPKSAPAAAKPAARAAAAKPATATKKSAGDAK